MQPERSNEQKDVSQEITASIITVEELAKHATTKKQ
jgi:hypothetical protein